MNLIGNRISDCFDPCICSTVDIEQLLLESKVQEVRSGKDLRDDLYHGWTCDLDAEEKIDKIQTYKAQLEIEYLCRSLGGDPCLTCEELQLLYEQMKRLTATCTDIGTPDLITDDSNLDLWVAQNPYCVSKERWEYLVYDILCDLNLDVKIINQEEACDLTLDIIKKEIPCDLIIAIEIQQKACNLGLEVIRKDLEECNVDFDVLVKNIDCKIGLDLHVKKLDCELTLEHYAKLVDCNLSLSVISCVYENGSCLSIADQLGAEVLLHTVDNVYPLSSIQFLDSPDVQSLTKYGVDIKGEYIKNPELFVQNLNKEYSGSI